MFRRLIAEGLGALLLAATVIGSGIMAEQLAAGNTAVALLANTGATVAVLAVLIALLGPISGAHFNPAVSIVQGLRRALPWYEVGAYSGAYLRGYSARGYSRLCRLTVGGCSCGLVDRPESLSSPREFSQIRLRQDTRWRPQHNDIGCHLGRSPSPSPRAGCRMGLASQGGADQELGKVSGPLRGCRHRPSGVNRYGKVFAKAYLEYGALTWPGGIDLAPDAMYERICKSGTSVVAAKNRMVA